MTQISNKMEPHMHCSNAFQKDDFDNIIEQVVGIFVQQEVLDHEFISSMNGCEASARRLCRPNINKNIAQGACQIF